MKGIARDIQGKYCSRMENNGNQKSRPFAAKYKYKWQGWVTIFISASCLSSGEPIAIVLGILLAGFGVYLLRGQGSSPKSIERSQKKADKLKSKIEDATRELSNSSGGRAVVAYRNLQAVLKSTKSPDYLKQFDEILAEIKFDKSSIQSDHIGSISGPGMLQ